MTTIENGMGSIKCTGQRNCWDDDQLDVDPLVSCVMSSESDMSDSCVRGWDASQQGLASEALGNYSEDASFQRRLQPLALSLPNADLNDRLMTYFWSRSK